MHKLKKIKVGTPQWYSSVLSLFQGEYIACNNCGNAIRRGYRCDRCRCANPRDECQGPEDDCDHMTTV